MWPAPGSVLRVRRESTSWVLFRANDPYATWNLDGAGLLQAHAINIDIPEVRSKLPSPALILHPPFVAKGQEAAGPLLREEGRGSDHAALVMWLLGFLGFLGSWVRGPWATGGGLENWGPCFTPAKITSQVT